MTTTLDNIPWSAPKRINTSRGPRILRTAPATQEFWALWRAQKAKLQAAGIGCGKTPSGEWQVCHWAEDTAGAEAAKKNRELSSATSADIRIPAPEGLSYLPYQLAGIQYALGKSGVLIGDEMGLGKTIQALGVINADVSIKRTLIICPASLKLNWRNEANKWLCGDHKVVVLPCTDKQAILDVTVVIINYDILKKHRALLRSVTWDLLVVDEAHFLKNPKAQRTAEVLGKWAKDPAKAIPKIAARKRIFLTGTPIVNRPIEGHALFSSLDPTQFGNWKRYVTRYCDGHRTTWGWDVTGASNLDELQDKLRGSFLLRRLKKDVLKELPAKRRQVIEIAANGASAAVKAEQKAVAAHKARLEELAYNVAVAKACGTKEEYEKAVHALQRGHSAEFTELSELRHKTALAKVAKVVEHVDSALTEGPVIVFAHHRDVVERLQTDLTDLGHRCVRVIGGDSAEAKQEAVEAFQAGEADVFVGNIQAAGVGLTLTRSKHVIFAELDWVPGNLSQCEDRAHRIGQEDTVLCQHLVLEGSLDAHIARVIVDKQKVLDAALDDPTAKIEASEPVAPVSLDGFVLQEVKPDAAALPPAQVDAIHYCLRRLAGDCDGAKLIDGAGFNKFDTLFGKTLAAAPALTPRQAAAGRLLVQKYQGQLPEEIVATALGKSLAAV